MCTYPPQNFQTRYPRHTYFFIWPKETFKQAKHYSVFKQQLQNPWPRFGASKTLLVLTPVVNCDVGSQAVVLLLLNHCFMLIH